MTKLQSSSSDGGDLRLGISLFIAVLIGAGFFYLATRAVPIKDVRAYLETADWVRLGWASLLFVALYSLSHAARVVRWYFLVRPLGKVDSTTVHRVCTVGFTAILLVPFRLGELVRPFFLARNSTLPTAGILSTVVVERVIDGLIVTGLLFVALWTYQGEASTEFARTVGTISALIFVGALFMCVLGTWRGDLANRLVMATFGLVSKKVATALVTLLDQFISGFGAIARRPADLFPFLGLTAVYWFTNIFSMWVLLRVGFDLNVGLWDMVTVLAVLVVGIMVPAGPAMAGNFEYFMAQGMGLYVPLDDPVVSGQVGAFAALIHLLQIAVIVIPGAWVMVRNRGLRLSRKALQESKEIEVEAQ